MSHSGDSEGLIKVHGAVKERQKRSAEGTMRGSRGSEWYFWGS